MVEALHTFLGALPRHLADAPTKLAQWKHATFGVGVHRKGERSFHEAGLMRLYVAVMVPDWVRCQCLLLDDHHPAHTDESSCCCRIASEPEVASPPGVRPNP